MQPHHQQRDIAIIWVNGQGEITLDDSDFLVDDSYTNQVIISLLTDKAATPEMLQEYGLTQEQNRGWWGDSYSNSDWGSWLWLLEREKSHDEVCERAEDYANDALDWMRQLKTIQSIEVSATREASSLSQVKDHLAIHIDLTLTDGSEKQRVLKMEFD